MCWRATAVGDGLVDLGRVGAGSVTKPLVGQQSTKINVHTKGFRCCSTVPRCRCHVRP
jgi:hypothetical protein